LILVYTLPSTVTEVGLVLLGIDDTDGNASIENEYISRADVTYYER